jgi:hypothetical protein
LVIERQRLLSRLLQPGDFPRDTLGSEASTADECWSDPPSEFSEWQAAREQSKTARQNSLAVLLMTDILLT